MKMQKRNITLNRILQGCLIVICLYASASAVPPPEPQPDISVTPASKDFGVVNGDSSSSPQAFTVKNIGTLSLIINTVSPTGTNASDFAVQNDLCSNQTLAQDGTCTVDVVFSPASGGALGANLSIPSNDPDTPTLDVSLSGTGTAPEISASPVSIDFGTVNICSSSEQTITVSNSGNQDLNIGSITGPSAPFSMTTDNCSNQTLQEASSCTITVGFSPTAMIANGSSISIPSNDLDENPLIINLSGTGGYCGPDIAVSPTALSYGSINVGVTADSDLTVKNEGNANLSITSIAVAGTNSSEFSINSDNCSGQTIAPNGSCIVKVRFAPTSGGSKAASLSIQSNDPDENPMVVSLSGTGVATTPLPENPPPDDGGSKGGPCFIATAAYGSYLDPHVKVLRDFRDNYLLINPIGRAFVKLYYSTSPPIAEFIGRHESLRMVTRWALTPVVYAVRYPYFAAFMILLGGVVIAKRRRN